MKKEIIWTNLSFGLGIIGMIITTLSLAKVNQFFGQIGNGIIAIVLGLAGLYLAITQSRAINDDLSKAGFVVNPLSILLGIISILLYLL